MKEKTTNNESGNSKIYCFRAGRTQTENADDSLQNGTKKLKKDKENQFAKAQGFKRKWTQEELNAIEDKELRKKLRNRQSAMAARERKKAKMEQLENKVSNLF